jgi:tetratricopeptide (TPR) repeat protein
LAIRETLVTDFPAVPEYRRDLALSHNNLGNLLRDQGRHPEAGAAYRAALDFREKLATDFPAVTAFQVDLGGSYCNFGILTRDGGKPAESLEWFGKAIDTLRAVRDEVNHFVGRSALRVDDLAGHLVGRYPYSGPAAILTGTGVSGAHRKKCKKKHH